MSRTASASFLSRAGGSRSGQSDLARRAFERLTDAVSKAVSSASPHTLELILGARDPLEALTLARRDLVPPPPERAEAIRRAQLAGVEMRQELIDRLAGVLTRQEAAALLGTTPTALDRRRERGYVFAVPMGRHYVYPQDQFRQNAVVPGLRDVLSAMAGATPWLVLEFLTTPLMEFGNRTPFAVLAEAGGDKAVIAALRRRAALEVPGAQG